MRLISWFHGWDRRERKGRRGSRLKGKVGTQWVEVALGLLVLYLTHNNPFYWSEEQLLGGLGQMK